MSEPYYADDLVTLWHGDCRKVMRALPEASVDAIVTDPPYELGFMGKSWDRSGVAFDPATWVEALRVLKPGGHMLAFEPIILARKPLDGTVANTVMTHGTGALNIDASRIGMSKADAAAINAKHAGMDLDTYERPAGSSLNLSVTPMPLQAASAHDAGRWPANVILDEDQAAALDEQSGVTRSRQGSPRSASSGDGWGMTATGAEYDDIGGASRFFYVAKAGPSERPKVDGVAHPTVKPLALIRYLVRLITPPGGTVLDFFAGSGTTGEAAVTDGYRSVLIESHAPYLPLIVQRLSKPIEPTLGVLL